MPTGIILENDGTIQGASAPVLTFDDTNGFLEIAGCNVGIGTASPSNKLDIYDSSHNVFLDIDTDKANGVAGIRLINDVQQWKVKVQGTAGDIFGISDETNSLTPFTIEPNTPTNTLYLDSSGNVGIGTASPGAKLDVIGDGHFDGNLNVNDDQSGEGKITIKSGSTSEGNIYFSDLTDGRGRITYDHNIDELSLWTVSAERLTIKNDGKVGVGVTPLYQFDVLTDSASGYVANFQNDGNNANRCGIKIVAGADDGSGTTYYLRVDDGNGTFTGRLETVNGVFSLVDVSDRRLKQNIKDASFKALDLISAIKVREFKFKKLPNITHTGFVAQELEKVIPDVISKGEDGFLGTAKSELIPYLVKAIQEQQEQIEELKTENELRKQDLCSLGNGVKPKEEKKKSKTKKKSKARKTK